LGFRPSVASSSMASTHSSAPDASSSTTCSAHTDTHRHIQTHTDRHKHIQTSGCVVVHQLRARTDTHRDTQTHTDTYRHITTIQSTHRHIQSTHRHTQSTHRHTQTHCHDSDTVRYWAEKRCGAKGGGLKWREGEKGGGFMCGGGYPEA